VTGNENIGQVEKKTKIEVVEKCSWTDTERGPEMNGVEEAVKGANRTMNSMVGDASGKSGRLFLHYTP